MTQFYLVRHGQASFGHENYDKLSQTGHQQARWLGDYFQSRLPAFDAVMQGALVRHDETTKGILTAYDKPPPVTTMAALDEFDFEAVIRAFRASDNAYTLPDKPTAKDYFRLLRNAMQAWGEQKLDHIHQGETWQDFESRTREALSIIQNSGLKQVLVVSSGGTIAMMLRHILGLDSSKVISLNLQIKNASFTHCISAKQETYLSSFNCIPHLDREDRSHAITYS